MLQGCVVPEEHTAPAERRTSPPEPPPRRSLRLGLDTYSFHRTLTAKDPRHRHDLLWALDRLGELGLDGLQIDPSHFSPDDEAMLKRLEALARPRGLYVEFGAAGWDVPRLAACLRLTARFGGKAVRTFLGGEGTSREEVARNVEFATPALRHAAGVADAYDVDIAVENHGDLTSLELKDFLDGVGHPRVGACLDTGNSLFLKEDPLDGARRLAPYVRSVHLKDWKVAYDSDGHMRWTESVPGEGHVAVLEILRLLSRLRATLNVALEVPIHPSPDEGETVAKEWRHVTASAAAARKMLAEL